MATVQISVSEQTRERLERIADRQHQSIGAIVEQAVEQLDNALFWSTFHEQLASLRADPVVWATVMNEFQAFDEALLDGLGAEGDA